MLISILYALLVLVAIGILSAAILYFVAQKFRVIENPLIDEVAEALPGANCGGCGYAGCRALAEAMVKAGNLEGLFCPAGGNATAGKVADIMGLVAPVTEPKIAVVRCAGSPANSPAKIQYSGLHDCRFANDMMTGEGGCSYSCLGFGNCVTSCTFDAIHINPETNLPVVDEEKCTACGACVKACPRTIIELRNKGAKNRRVFVSCMNKEKGSEAKKNCSVACIACGKCQKICPFEAITIENQLAYIDFAKCKLCRKCVPECPTGAIWEVNFAPRKIEEPLPTEENRNTNQA